MTDPNIENLQGYSYHHAISPYSPVLGADPVGGLPHGQPQAKKPRRERTAFTAEQIAVLEEGYKKSGYPDVFQKEEICQITNLPEHKVTIWFKNRRAKDRKSAESGGQPDYKLDHVIKSERAPVSSGRRGGLANNAQMALTTSSSIVSSIATSNMAMATSYSDMMNPINTFHTNTTTNPSSYTYGGNHHQLFSQKPPNHHTFNQRPVKQEQGLYNNQPTRDNFLPRVSEEFEPILLKLLQQAPEDDLPPVPRLRSVGL